MELSLNILLDQLQDIQYESHVPAGDRSLTFSRAALLSYNFAVMRRDFIHVCRLSDALRAAAARPDMFYLCIRDRIRDQSESEPLVRGMVIVNENMDVELLFSMVQDIFVRLSQWYQDMQQALIREEDLQTIVSLSEPVLGNYIDVTDSGLTLLARTKGIEPKCQISRDLAAHGYHSGATLDLFRKYHRLEAYNSAQSVLVNDSRQMCDYTLVNRVFRFRNSYFFHVVMTCDHRPLTDGLLELFQMFTDLLAVYAERSWKDKNALSHHYDSFVLDLLSGTLTKPSDIQERARHLGLLASGQFVLLLLDVESGQEAILGRLGRELAEVLPGCQVVLYGQTVAALIRLEDGQESFPRDTLLRFLSRHQARGGISAPFTGLEHTPRARAQAALALRYAPPLPGHTLLFPPPGDGVLQPPVLCAFEDRAVYGLLGEHSANEDTWHGTPHYAALKALYDYDCKHNTNNLQLLRVYLRNERKATETSEMLHMHRNNVIYRIGRIEKMIGLDLNDPDTRTALELSYLMLELYGFPSPTAED